MNEKKAKTRGGLVKYPGGRTYFFRVRFRGEIRRGDTGCESYSAAVAWLKAERDRWALEGQGLKMQRVPTPAEVLRDWMEIQGPVVGEKHVDQVSDSVLVHLVALKDTPFDQITLVELEKARVRLLATPKEIRAHGKTWGKKERTKGGVNAVFKLFRAMWNWARERDYPVGVMPKLKPLEPQEVTEPVVWPELVPAFLAAVDFVPVLLDEKGKRVPRTASMPLPRPDDQRIAVRLQLYLGLREGEALGFDWRYMDWRRAIYAPPETKNRKAREVPVEELDLLPLLRARWEAQGKPAAGFALPAHKGTPHRVNYTQRTVRDAGEAVGLVGLHPHRLRATFATTLWEIGTPLSQIQQMMGHKDPETTLIYIVQRPKDQTEAVRKMGAAMGSGTSATTVPPRIKNPSKAS